MSDARQAAEFAARVSYGRLVAYLAARSRDVTAAEDALGDAFVAALETWPRDGVPDKAEAWLLTVARRRLLDAARHTLVAAGAATELRGMVERAEAAASSPIGFPDERLRLLFVCAHPAIDAAVRTPLMLQTVLGLDAARVAAAFLVPPATMGQRLVLRHAPTIGARVAAAAAIGEARGTGAALAALGAVAADAVASYQPYWALSAHLLARAGRAKEARDAYARAAELTGDEAVRAFLSAQAAALDGGMRS